MSVNQESHLRAEPYLYRAISAYLRQLVCLGGSPRSSRVRDPRRNPQIEKGSLHKEAATASLLHSRPLGPARDTNHITPRAHSTQLVSTRDGEFIAK